MTTIDRVEETRRRLIGTLFAGNAIASTAYIGVATVLALIAEEITGSTSLSGLAPTLGTLGVAFGAAVLSWTSLRVGRRPSFTFGFALAAAGAVLALVSIGAANLLLLLLGSFLVGTGRSVTQLARYAAGDMRTQDRRASAISIIVWASTFGAIIGPLMIGPTSTFAVTAGFNEYVGPISMAVVGFALGTILMFVALRPDPITLVVDETHADDDADAQLTPLPSLLASRTVQLSITAIVISQMVMVLVMVMTPLHIRDNDGSLAIVGWVMMAHAVGMFAIAPFTGWLVNRLGALTMIGIAVLAFVASCGIAVAATSAQTWILLVSMFGVGVAWNFGYVSGSTLLQDGVAARDRLKLQGFADSSAWITSAFAAALSGVVLAATSYGALAILGAVLAMLPLIPMQRLSAATAEG